MEFYRYLEKEDYDTMLTDHNKKSWRYYSKKKMREIYPNNDYHVVGQVNVLSKSTYDKYIIHGDKKLKLRSLKSNSFLYTTCGYMACTNAETDREFKSIEYVAVKKNQVLKSALLLSLALLLMFGGLFWYMNRDQGPIFDDSAIAYKMPDGVSKNTDPNSISIPGYGVLTMDSKKQEIYVALLNPEGNPCYFRYDIVLKDSNKSIYRSDLIKPGMAVTTAKINQKLEAGTYDITMLINTASLDDHTQELNGGAVETTLVVK